MTADTSRRRGLKFNWKAVVGITLSLGLLYFALRDVDAKAVIHEIAHANLLIYLASVVVATLGFAIRAWRWKPLLKPISDDVHFRPRYAATCVGFMANNLLPARIGEFLRCYVLARLETLPITGVIGSLVLERVFDGVTIIAFVFLALAVPGFPETGAGAKLRAIASTMVIVLAVAMVILFAMVLWPKAVVRFFERTIVRILPHHTREAVVNGLEALIGGLSAIRNPVLLVQIIFLSIVVWTLGALSYWLGLAAFDIRVPFTGAIFLQSLISLAVAIPSGPGFFGPFEAGVRVGLVEIWNIDINKAMGFAIGFHLGGFIPVTVIGLYYVWRLGLSLRGAAAEAEEVKP